MIAFPISNNVYLLIITVGLLIGAVRQQEDDFCTIGEDCGEDPLIDDFLIGGGPSSGKYKQGSDYFYQKVTAFKDSPPSVCQHNNCSCFLDVLKQDLWPFRDGISKQLIDDIRNSGTKYQIIDHKLYRQKECMFPARCSGIEYFIKANLEELPDTEMIVNCRDWPQVNRHWGQQGPVFSFSKTDEFLDIMYPAWSFWEGGPAISLYPTGLGRWDRHRLSVTKEAEMHPWDKKTNKAFFRGSRTSSERDALILLSREHPNLVDAQYTKNQAWKSPSDTLGAEPAKEVSLEEHCAYKYLFNFRGVAASFRFKHLFLCKSLIFHVGDEWQEFFYDALIPWYHYVPVKADATKEQLHDMLEFFRDHDDLANSIAERSFDIIWRTLTMESIHCYWRELIQEYTKLLKFQVVRDEKLIAI